MSPALIVIAKTPQAGVSKTRLCPPCTAREAAALAEAALCDTLAASVRSVATRVVLSLDGTRGDWLVPGVEVLPQRGRGLAQRLRAAFEDVQEPALLIGMDTPQITPALLNHCLARLSIEETDAVIGPALDGGYWAIGLKPNQRDPFDGVPMSAGETLAAQHARLAALGMRCAELPPLRDVDRFDDALAVASEAPTTRFAKAVAGLNIARAVAA